LAISIDVGGITNGSSNGIQYLTYTQINLNNPANDTGKLTSVQIRLELNNGTNVEIATFYLESENHYSTRDTYFIGDVAEGSTQNFSIDLDVSIGDYIGLHGGGGAATDGATGGSFTKASGDYIPCTNVNFSPDAYSIDIYATGIAVPVQVTNVQATDGTYTDKVVVTWTKSSGATDYQVYRDGVGLGWLGDVATYNDTGANAPTITVGTASASDGTDSDYVTLSITGESTNNGTTHTYKVRAKNAAGESGDSATNTGYRGVGTLTYQWQRSAGDSDADYSNISGGTTDPYNDIGAPANGDGRYYRCVENATGAAEVTTNADRGYRLALTGNAIFFGCNF